MTEWTCRKCGGSSQDAHGRCKPCRSAYVRQYRQKNLEKVRAVALAWKAANKDKVSASDKRTRLKHPEKRKAKDRKYSQSHKAERRIVSATYRANNQERINAYHRAYIAKRREGSSYGLQESIYQHEWRVRNRGSAHRSYVKRAGYNLEPLSPLFFDKFVEYTGSRCFDCGIKSKMTMGHLQPVSKDGSNDITNIIPQCRSCNSKQHNHPHPFLDEMRKNPAFSESMVFAK